MSRLLKAALVPLLLFVLTVPASAMYDDNVGNNIMTEMERILNGEEKKTLDDYGVSSEKFENMMGRISLLGALVKRNGETFRVHDTVCTVNDVEYKVYLARSTEHAGLVFVAVYQDGEDKNWGMVLLDMDEDGVPDYVIGQNSFGQQELLPVNDLEMDIYIGAVKALLNKKVRYPPKEEGNEKIDTDLNGGKSPIPAR